MVRFLALDLPMWALTNCMLWKVEYYCIIVCTLYSLFAHWHSVLRHFILGRCTFCNILSISEPTIIPEEWYILPLKEWILSNCLNSQLKNFLWLNLEIYALSSKPWHVQLSAIFQFVIVVWKWNMFVWIALQAWEFLESYHSFNSHHLEIVEYPPQYNSRLCLHFFFNNFLPYIPAPEHGLDCCMCQESLHLSNNQFQKINVNKNFKLPFANLFLKIAISIFGQLCGNLLSKVIWEVWKLCELAVRGIRQ